MMFTDCGVLSVLIASFDIVAKNGATSVDDECSEDSRDAFHATINVVSTDVNLI